MTEAARHVIRRATVEVTGSIRADAFRFQDEVAVWAREQLLPALDELFSHVSESTESITLDRLELELGSSSHAHWRTEALTRLKSAMSLALGQAIASAGKDEHNQRLSPGRSFFLKLSHYLERGVFPWDLVVVSQRQFETEMFGWLESDAAPQARRDLYALFRLPSARTRFVSAFSEPLVQKALSRIFAVPDRIWRDWPMDVEVVERGGTSSGPRFGIGPRSAMGGISRTLLEGLVASLVSPGTAFDEVWEEGIIRASFARLVLERRLEPSALGTLRFSTQSFSRARDAYLREHGQRVQPPSAPGMPTYPTEAHAPAAAAAARVPPRDEVLQGPELALPAHSDAPAASPAAEVLPETGLAGEAKLRSRGGGIVGAPMLHPSPVVALQPADVSLPVPDPLAVREPNSNAPASRPSAAQDPHESLRSEQRVPTRELSAEGYFIQDAGLILLAPFLSTLFERLALASSGELKDPAAAMALLHFLATGREAPAEFQVVLPKVLCGWPLDKPVSLPEALAADTKAEARQLLESVIGHWAILKNTSVEGVQESFLQRPGKLSLTARGDWLLQVEQKAYDMLLQQLPWSFSWTRLPWMRETLRTEWVG